jgi:hypothetical protein
VAHGMRYQVISATSKCLTPISNICFQCYCAESSRAGCTCECIPSGRLSLQARALAAIPAEPDVSRWMAGTTALREDNEVSAPNALQHLLDGHLLRSRIAASVMAPC